MRHTRAYTLVEVLIVVTIIGIASAIVVPHLLAASTLGVQAAARIVIADLIYAQNEAVVQQKHRRVVVDTDNERYWLENDVGDPIFLEWRIGGDAFVDFLRDERFAGVSIAAVSGTGGSWTFTEDGGTLVFDFDELGAPGSGGHIGLIAGEQRFVVSIAEFTGRVTVEEAQ